MVVCQFSAEISGGGTGMKKIMPPWASEGIELSDKPLFVCWEVTKACKLSCRHCRAKAIRRSLPGELSHEQGLALIDQITGFGEPYPALLFTGGDPLMRPDIIDLISHARDLGIYTAVAASVTDLLNEEIVSEFRDLGVGVMSISLDGSTPETHDGIRRVPGTWEKSLEILQTANKIGLRAQINTTVMRSNIDQLADIFDIALRYNVAAWEVFFLVRTGRGVLLENPYPEEIEEVMRFLSVAAEYGLPVRSSEGPHFRRVIRQNNLDAGDGGPLFRKLRDRLEELRGKPTHKAIIGNGGTGDGRGVMMVTHNGEITPSGFLPIPLGVFPEDSIVDVYRDNSTFRDLRDPTKLKGKCGTCEYREICGGSRSRAYVELGDALESDPLCIYEPARNR